MVSVELGVLTVEQFLADVPLSIEVYDALVDLAAYTLAV